MSQSAVVHNAIAAAASLTSHEQPAVTCTSDEEGGTRNTASPPSLSLPSVPASEGSPTKKRGCEDSTSSPPANKKAKESPAAAADVDTTASGDTSHEQMANVLSSTIIDTDPTNGQEMDEVEIDDACFLEEEVHNNILSKIIAEEEKEGADDGGISDASSLSHEKSDAANNLADDNSSNEEGNNVEYIKEVRENDCLFGVQGDPGRRRYINDFLKPRQASYTATSNKGAKEALVVDIVQKWRLQVPPGRFLLKDKESELYYEAGDEEAKRRTRGSLEKKSDKKQIEYIDEPRINDCLFTGGSSDPKSAKCRYEETMLEKRSLFHKSDKEGRALIANEIVQEWQALVPPGRFLRLDKGNGKWYNMSSGEGVKKVTSRWLEKMTMQGLQYQDRTENDMVIGKKYKHRSGNKKYQELLASKKMLYREASRNDKASIAMEIVQAWRGQNPPGRFLEECIGDYSDIGDEAAKKKIMSELGKGSRTKKQRDSNDSNGTAVSVSEDGAEVIQKIKSKQSGDGKENISPYQTDSSYNDVLSFFASTPFDADVQTTLHVQKELSFQRSSLILPSRATLHIVPQKQFIKGKAPASGGNEDNSDDATLTTASDEVDREASKFLLEEAKYLLKKRESTKVRPASSPKMPQNGQCPISEVCNGESRNGLSVIAALQEAQDNDPTTAPTIAMASKQINSASVNVEQTAKLPVAFGFHLDDDGTSKHLAQAATDNWKSHGEKSAKKSNKGLRVSIGSVKKASTGLPVCHTPKVAKTPSSATPKTPKTPALLLSTEAARKLPDGWVSKTYKRMAGKTAGTKDIYFYSPQKQIKFRAMKSCKTFIEIMGELEVDGDEAAALKLYKERGHRF